MCPAIHITSRSWLRSSSTHEPSDPPLRVVFGFRIQVRRPSAIGFIFRTPYARAKRTALDATRSTERRGVVAPSLEEPERCHPYGTIGRYWDTIAYRVWDGLYISNFSWLSDVATGQSSVERERERLHEAVQWLVIGTPGHMVPKHRRLELLVAIGLRHRTETRPPHRTASDVR